MHKRDAIKIAIVFGVTLSSALVLYFTVSQFQRRCRFNISDMTPDEHANTCKIINDAKQVCLYGCEQAWAVMRHRYGDSPDCTQSPLPFPNFSELNPICQQYYSSNVTTDCLFGVTSSVQNFIGRATSACQNQLSCETAVQASVAIAASITGLVSGLATWQRFSLWGRASQGERLIQEMETTRNYSRLDSA